MPAWMKFVVRAGAILIVLAVAGYLIGATGWFPDRWVPLVMWGSGLLLVVLVILVVFVVGPVGWSPGLPPASPPAPTNPRAGAAVQRLEHLLELDEADANRMGETARIGTVGAILLVTIGLVVPIAGVILYFEAPPVSSATMTAVEAAFDPAGTVTPDRDWRLLAAGSSLSIIFLSAATIMIQITRSQFGQRNVIRTRQAHLHAGIVAIQLADLFDDDDVVDRTVQRVIDQLIESVLRRLGEESSEDSGGRGPDVAAALDKRLDEVIKAIERPKSPKGGR